MRPLKIRVTAPDGSDWVVARRWIPRWAAARLRRSVGDPLRRRDRRNRRRRNAPEDGSTTRWYDFLDVPVGGGGCLDEVAVVAVAVAVIAAVWFLVIPLLLLVVNLLIAVALVIVVGVSRVLLRRPWVVEARGDGDAVIRRMVVGWTASAAEVRRLGSEITQGVARPSEPPPAGP